MIGPLVASRDHVSGRVSRSLIVLAEDNADLRKLLADGLARVGFAVVEAENGAGCDLTGGAGNGSDCQCDYQSPGPTFGDAITITIP